VQEFTLGSRPRPSCTFAPATSDAAVGARSRFAEC
jgi:hypothetical protein